MSKVDGLIAQVILNPAKRMRVLRFTNTVVSRRPLLVRGFFGSGKTQRAGEAALYIYYKVHNDRQFRVRHGAIVPIFALPLRRLRDQVFDRFFDDEVAFKFKAHDEVCEPLRRRIKEESDYWKALAKHLAEDDCKYKDHVAELLEAIKREKVIVTTHGLAPVVDVLAKQFKRKPLVFFDEGEDFLERISKGIDGTVVEALKDLNKKLYQKVKRVFKKEHYKYYYREQLLVQLLRDVVILSATFPKSIVATYPFLTGKELDETWVWTKERKVKDVAVFYTGKLLWKQYTEWKPVVFSQIADLVRVGVERYGVVGIVSRNYRMTSDLVSLVSNLGYRVTSDLSPDFRHEISTVQVIIVTIKGKLYRGINILRNLDDVKLVLAFYQGSIEYEHHPALLDVLQKFGDGERDLYPVYVKEMKMAKNLQAVYRFVRRHDNRHVLVFFDWRYHEAFYHFFRNKLSEDIIQVEVDDLRRIADVAKLYIITFFLAGETMGEVSGYTALDLIKKVEEKKVATELKVKTKELEVILIDYREQLTRYDLYAVNFDYILMLRKSHEKADEIIKHLDEFRPVKVRVTVKVDIVPAGPDLEMVEDITGDVVEILEVEPLTDVLNTPLFRGVGIVGFSRSGAVRIRSDGETLVVNTATRNGERIKVFANREAEVLYTVAKIAERASGYKIAEGIYFIPVEKIREMIEEQGTTSS